MLTTARRTVGCALLAIAVPVKAVVGVSVAGALAGALAGAATLAAPAFRYSRESKSLERTAVRLRDFKNAVANGADLTIYRDHLAQSQCDTLYKVAAEIQAKRERERVLED